jgi:endonuclease-3
VNPEEYARLASRLASIHGLPGRGASLSATDELIATILSQSTNDRNRDRAFQSLKHHFPEWGSVVTAPTEEIIDAIRMAGLAPTKAPRIQQVLERIRDRFGVYDIPTTGPPSELLSFLLALPGVGPKTARIVLLFSLGHPFFPMDTHILRVGGRLGLLTEHENPGKAMARVESRIPVGEHAHLHLLLLEHGRRICRPKPHCSLCPLQDACRTYQAHNVTVRSDR